MDHKIWLVMQETIWEKNAWPRSRGDDSDSFCYLLIPLTAKYVMLR